jgi:hypothetical protein
VSALVWAVVEDRPYNFAHRVFDDVVHNLGRGVIDTSGFSHLRFFFYFCPMAFGEPDNLSKKLLVDMA